MKTSKFLLVAGTQEAIVTNCINVTHKFKSRTKHSIYNFLLLSCVYYSSNNYDEPRFSASAPN